MGVVYKLTQEIVDFIINSKKQDNNLSLNATVQKVQETFNKKVSKSAVHEIFKEAGLTSLRGSKSKTKLIATSPLPSIRPPVLSAPTLKLEPPPLATAITQEKKPTLPIIEAPQPVVAQAEPAQITNTPQVIEKELVKTDIEEQKGNIFLLAAAWHLLPNFNTLERIEDMQAVQRNDLNLDWTYWQTQVKGYRIRFEDDSCFYINPQNGNLFQNGNFLKMVSEVEPQNGNQFPIELAIKNMAEQWVNNLKPIVINDLHKNNIDDCVADVCAGCLASSKKRFKKIELLNTKGEEIASFDCLTKIKRQFILNLSPKVIELQKVVNNSLSLTESIYSPVLEKKFFFAEHLWASSWIGPDGQPISLRAIGWGLESQQLAGVILTNMEARNSSGKILLQYAHQYDMQTPQTFQSDSRDDLLILSGNFMQRMDEYAQILWQFKENPQGWESVKNLSGFELANDKNRVINLISPNGYEYLDILKLACQKINNARVFDPSGRQIWMRIADTK